MAGTRAVRRASALVVVSVVALAAFWLVGGTAQGGVPASNGKIVFGRSNPDIGDFNIFTANPDGSDQRQTLPGAAECPRWSPDGTRIQVCIVSPAGLLRPAIANADGTGLTLVHVNDPDLNLACWAWSAKGLLACESWSDANPSRLPGVFTVRSSDGGGLKRLTTNAAGNHDLPGDFSPDGSKVVFLRGADPSTETGTLFVVGTDGRGLHRISPSNVAQDPGSWSPNGKWILFSTTEGKLFKVHPDGSELTRIPIHTGVPGPSYVAQPSWSPDGSRIVARVFVDSAGSLMLATMTASGRDLDVMTGTGVADEFADWGARARCPMLHRVTAGREEHVRGRHAGSAARRVRAGLRGSL